MGKTYEWNLNPFRDFLFMSMMYGTDLADKEFEVDIFVGFSTILDYFVLEKDSREFLDFQIKGKDGYYKVVGNNIVSALWLLGIFPPNPRQVIKTNEFVLENIKYRFNPKTKKITYQQKNRKIINNE